MIGLNLNNFKTLFYFSLLPVSWPTTSGLRMTTLMTTLKKIERIPRANLAPVLEVLWTSLENKRNGLLAVVKISPII